MEGRKAGVFIPHSLMGATPRVVNALTCVWLNTPTTRQSPKCCSKRLLTCSVQFSRLFVSDCLWPGGLQHARLLCPSLTPRLYSNSCPLSQWCHPTISASVVPFSSRLQSFPASGSFPVSQFFDSGGQSMTCSGPANSMFMIMYNFILLYIVKSIKAQIV